MTQTKYHITKDGKVAPCHATTRPCPLGGADVHFKSKEEAQQHIQDVMEKEHGLLDNNEHKEVDINTELREASQQLEYKIMSSSKDYEQNIQELAYIQQARVNKKLSEQMGYVDKATDLYRQVQAIGDKSQPSKKDKAEVKNLFTQIVKQESNISQSDGYLYGLKQDWKKAEYDNILENKAIMSTGIFGKDFESPNFVPQFSPEESNLNDDVIALESKVQKDKTISDRKAIFTTIIAKKKEQIALNEDKIRQYGRQARQDRQKEDTKVYLEDVKKLNQHVGYNEYLTEGLHKYEKFLANESYA